jgi:hydrogenase maturation protease
MNQARSILVLGVGNVYYGDEGAGVHLVHYLRSKYSFPPGVDVIDGGTLGWDLLNLIAEYQHVVLIDAVSAPVGKVYRFTRDDVPAEIGYGKLSSHEWEVPDLLTAMDLYGDLPQVTIVAIGVDPLCFGVGEVGVLLSDSVRERIGALATATLQTLAALDVQAVEVRPDLQPNTPFSAEAMILAHA